MLSSEGIYSPKSLPQFTSVLLNATRGKALIASKKVYFGVGGGVTEFFEELAKRNRTGLIVWEGGQVGRVIIQIEFPTPISLPYKYHPIAHPMCD